MFRISTQPKKKKKKSPIFPQISEPSNEHSEAQPLKSPKPLHFASEKTPKESRIIVYRVGGPAAGAVEGGEGSRHHHQTPPQSDRQNRRRIRAFQAEHSHNTHKTQTHSPYKPPHPPPKEAPPPATPQAQICRSRAGAGAAGARRARVCGRRRPMALVKRESGRWWRRGEERACCARLWGGGAD